MAVHSFKVKLGGTDKDVVYSAVGQTVLSGELGIEYDDGVPSGGVPTNPNRTDFSAALEMLHRAAELRIRS